MDIPIDGQANVYQGEAPPYYAQQQAQVVVVPGQPTVTVDMAYCKGVSLWPLPLVRFVCVGSRPADSQELRASAYDKRVSST